MAISQKIISGNDQPSGGNGVVSVGGARGLGNSGTLLTEVSSTNIVSPFPPLNASQLDDSVAVNDADLNYRYNADEVYTAAIGISGSGTQSVVSAITGHSIDVVSYAFVTDAATTFRWLSDSTPVSSGMYLAANGGAAISATDDGPLLSTSQSEALQVSSTAGNIGGHVSYKVG